ncbi:alpha-ketoglutarate-dependent dioxygenase AlkB [Actinomadura alba]|uniref:Alpha-ketoglutarate-dependent dioxygenase AlkB n=1 Tax=Actinomadura alba TaxID=406431 RepID=A0ABR7LL65_9ACTN|nr:alpha-ketoglutarate-dependent dioxygenase AlkB [Actinomadura alba]MBC6465616.1 alpha-ketoglutarate-dependent dioxygenase AlkB [Actinomadura alba]
MSFIVGDGARRDGLGDAVRAGDGAPPQAPEAVPGLRYFPGWLTPDAGETLLSSIDAAEWSEELRRRVQHYGHRYDYGRRSVAADSRAGVAPPLPAWAREQAVRLVREGILDQAADQAIINEYHPGQGISPHVDCVPCFGPVVAAISLGSACVMDFTDPGDGTKVAVPLAPGSLCVMTGPARYTWRHGIAARKSDPGPAGRVPRGRRVSVTFRTVVEAVVEAVVEPAR